MTQKTAWFMAHRIRAARDTGEIGDLPPLEGKEGVEADETYIGGRASNRRKGRRTRKVRRTRPGAHRDNKIIILGVKDRATKEARAKVVAEAHRHNVTKFVEANTAETAHVYTDESTLYHRLDRPHSTVNHSRWQFLADDGASTNEMESLWSEMKRGIRGVFRKISPKHARRYVDEFTGRLNARDSDTIDHMAALARGMRGRRLPYRRLIADNGRRSHARETAARAASCDR